MYTLNKRDWNDFSKEEKLVTENAALLVGLLYNMGKVELVLKSKDDSQPNTVNKNAIQKSMSDAKTILFEMDSQKESSMDSSVYLDTVEIKENIRSHITDFEYQKWIDSLKFKANGGSIQVIAPNRAVYLFVKKRYHTSIESGIAKYLGGNINLEYSYIGE